jgi:hypothetical protein
MLIFHRYVIMLKKRRAAYPPSTSNELTKRRIDMKQEETTIQLDLSVETLALLGQDLPNGPVGVETVPIRSCGSGSMCTPPTCCP